MTIPRKSERLQPQGEPVILFAVGPYTFAIAAAEIDEIREMSDLKPFTLPLSSSAIRYTLFRGGREYVVVDSSFHFRMPATTLTRVMVLRNHPVGVCVDSIDRMANCKTVYPLPAAFRGEEREWYKGLTLDNGRVLPFVNPKSFVPQHEMVLLSKLKAKGGIQ